MDEFQIKEILALIVMHQKMKMPFQLMDENASEGEMVGDVCDVNKAEISQNAVFSPPLPPPITEGV